MCQAPTSPSTHTCQPTPPAETETETPANQGNIDLYLLKRASSLRTEQLGDTAAMRASVHLDAGADAEVDVVPGELAAQRYLDTYDTHRHRYSRQ